jgi:glycosyltransferase involved in cell wall biosynthesis
MRSRIQAANASGVRLLGFQNQTELPRCYDLADLFCVPSHREPWGLVVNEAMCAARPVLASDAVGSARDLVLDGETGATFRVGDVDDLEQRLRELLALPRGALRALGARARARVSGFDFEADARGLFAALESLKEDQP